MATKTVEVRAWEEDPGVPGDARTPIPRPAPDLPGRALPVKISGRTPSPKPYAPGTAGFRYWTAAEALRRGADFWAGLVPGLTWHSTVGAQLRVGLDQGEDFNAFYDRAGLQFFHGPVDGTLVYSGESPDVACHELGHAPEGAPPPVLRIF